MVPALGLPASGLVDWTGGPCWTSPRGGCLGPNTEVAQLSEVPMAVGGFRGQPGRRRVTAPVVRGVCRAPRVVFGRVSRTMISSAGLRRGAGTRGGGPRCRGGGPPVACTGAGLRPVLDYASSSGMVLRRAHQLGAQWYGRYFYRCFLALQLFYFMA